MPIRRFRPADAPALAALALDCARGETDFVLNPLWETADELFAEFARFEIRPEEHLLVADEGDDGEVQGMVGFLRRPRDRSAGMLCPIVRRKERGRGVGGELLRAAQRHGAEQLGIELATAGIGTRNRGGYSLLTSHGFRPVRQAYVMSCEQSPAVPEVPIAGLEIETRGPTTPRRSSRSTCRAASRAAARSACARCSATGATRTRWRARAARWSRSSSSRRTGRSGRGWRSSASTKERRDRGLGSSLVAWLLARQFAAGAKAGAARALARQPHRAARLREGGLPPLPADRRAREEALMADYAG